MVVGGPEDLLDLTDLGLLGDQPTRLATDVTGRLGPATPLVLTDGLRARERFFGRVHDGASATLTPGDVRRSGNPVRDYLLDSDDRWSTTVRLSGARSLSASSSMSDSSAPGGARVDQLPFAAVDASRSTAWVSDPTRPGRASWTIRLDRATAATSVRVAAGAGADPAQRVRVRTARGTTRPVDLGPREAVEVALPPGRTSWLRVQDASGAAGRRLSLADVRLPGVEVRRSLVLPRLPDRWPSPSAVVLRAQPDARTGCVLLGSEARCVPGRDRAGEEVLGLRRVVTLPRSATYRPRVSVRPRPGRALTNLLQRGQPARATASSVAVRDARASALAAIDGDRGTTWTAAPGDLRPTLRLSWLGRRLVSGLRLSVDADADARRPRRVTLVWPGGRREVTLDRTGRVRLAPFRTDRLEVRVTSSEDVSDLGFDSTSSPVPVGVGEARVRGVPFLPLGLSTTAVDYGCGSGPRLEVDGRSYPTAVRAAPADLARMRGARARVCGAGALRLAPGAHRVVTTSSRAFTTDAVVLRRGDRAGAGDATGAGVGPTGTRDLPVTSPSAVRRVVPPGGARYVALRENVNPGWRATQRGQPLAPVTVDGWQQGFRVTGRGPVRIDFGPDATYRWGLAVGLLGLLVLAGACLVPRRRWPGAGLPAALGRRVPPAAMLAAASAGGALLAGWPGVALFAGVMVLRRSCAAVGPPGHPRGRAGSWPPPCWAQRARTPSGRGATPPAGPAPWPGRPTWRWCRWPAPWPRRGRPPGCRPCCRLCCRPCSRRGGPGRAGAGKVAR